MVAVSEEFMVTSRAALRPRSLGLGRNGHSSSLASLSQSGSYLQGYERFTDTYGEDTGWETAAHNPPCFSLLTFDRSEK